MMHRTYRTITTETYQIGTAQALGCDPEGGKWVYICLVHQTIQNFSTKRDAIECVTNHAMKLCEPCVTEYYKEVA